MQRIRQFEHERLRAYAIVRDALRLVAKIIAQVERGEGDLVNQVKRAGDSALLNLCEGAARTSPRDKARFYDIAAGSAAECGGALELMELRRLAPAELVATAQHQLREATAVLAGLARGARARAGARG